jgi:hypothetical protein
MERLLKENNMFKIKIGNNKIEVEDKDCFVSNVIFPWEYNPNNVKPFLVHECDFHSAIVWAEEANVLDFLADEYWMNRYLIEEKDLKDYLDEDGNETCVRLGNASEPYDIENLTIEELDPNSLPVQLLCKFAEARGRGLDTLDDF